MGINKYNDKQLARHRYVAVCYNLLNDLSASNAMDPMKTVLNVNKTENIQSTPSEQKDMHKQHVLNKNMTSAVDINKIYYDHYYNMNNSMQWIIGLQTSSHPQKMMQHVLESLKLI